MHKVVAAHQHMPHIVTQAIPPTMLMCCGGSYSMLELYMHKLLPRCPSAHAAHCYTAHTTRHANVLRWQLLHDAVAMLLLPDVSELSDTGLTVWRMCVWGLCARAHAAAKQMKAAGLTSTAADAAAPDSAWALV